jgi:taurine dioxygenase
MFANQYLAFETLTDGMKEMLNGMNAVHSSAMPHGREEARFGAVSRDRAATEKDRIIEDSMANAEKIAPITNLHPVIRIHPDTGKQFLYVNRAFTERFEHMTIEESLPLLHTLWNHAARPEFTCRYRWSPNAVAIWDNRASQHYAINDYYGVRRHMQRIAVHEEENL